MKSLVCILGMHAWSEVQRSPDPEATATAGYRFCLNCNKFKLIGTGWGRVDPKDLELTAEEWKRRMWK